MPGLALSPDYLAQLLRRGDAGPGLLALGLAAAFALGALHALSPGHGKTIVAAYLVGSRGSFRHALYLGGVVTFTHTVSVFALGLATLYLSHYVLPDRIFPVLAVISGASIVGIGGWLLWRRTRALLGQGGHHHPHHDHPHSHGEEHHHHVPEVTLGGLIALGASGGLVPCPSALVLLLSSVALGRVGLGLVLLLGFSAGLAFVLTAIGGLVLYAKRLLPSGATLHHPVVRLLPVLSAGVIVAVGVIMTAAAAGAVR